MQEIRKVVDDYLQGMVYAEDDRIRRAFHPDAILIGQYKGVLEWDPVEKFIADCAAAGAFPRALRSLRR